MISFPSLRSMKVVKGMMILVFLTLSIATLLLYVLSRRRHHCQDESYVRKCRWERNPRQLNQTIEVCEETTES